MSEEEETWEEVTRRWAASGWARRSSGGRLEFNEALGRVNLEHLPAIMAIIGDMMFLGKQEEGEYVGDAIFVDICLIETKISNIVGRHNALVAVNLDGMSSWTNIVNISRVGEKINYTTQVCNLHQRQSSQCLQLPPRTQDECERAG